MPDLKPMPLGLLAQHVLDDGSDYDDGVAGWVAGRLDKETGVLEITYQRDEEYPSDDPDPDLSHSHTGFRFQLIGSFEFTPPPPKPPA